MKLDVIIPSFNEEESVEKLYNKLSETLKDIKYRLIFVDDGSKDSTFEKLSNIYKEDKKHVAVVQFSRNFGKDAAIYAGMKVSTAEYTCIIDADLQQNPKYILDMLDYLEKHDEYDEVCMTNDYNDSSFINKIFKKQFYKLMTRLSGQQFKVGASDFRMFRKYVNKAILELGETERFSKGLFAWVGFNIYYMPYKVEKRIAGKSKFNLGKQFSYAKDGIYNFSIKPLKLATYLGTLISSISFIYLVYILIKTLIAGKDTPGYASLMCVILLLGGIQLIFLGIIGEYLGRNYMETKKRPSYVTKTKLGFDEDIL
jgi:glycosyltransferase involved in cell wall biosynthesis